VRAYYRRHDFLEMLLQVCRTRWVSMVVPATKHWPPPSDSDRVTGATRSELRDFIMQRIRERLDGLADADRPPFYPSFHVAVHYWRPGEVGADPCLGSDAVVETDLPTWRESFQDVMAWIHALRRANVVHRLKFSGHRSLHVLVPSAGDRLRVSLLAGGNADGITGGNVRLPYSLNEDTGLVSLPLTWERLHAFRPWQANLHLVDIHPGWLREASEEERDLTGSFLESLEQDRSASLRIRYEPAEHLDDVRAWAAVRLQPGSRGVAAASPHPPAPALATAWQQVCGLLPVTATHVRAALGHGDLDVRWLTLEAFLLHGTDLPEHLVVELMGQDDPYVLAAAVDVVGARFAAQDTAWLLDHLTSADLHVWTAIAVALAHSTRLRDDLSALLIGQADRPLPAPAAANALARLASVIGVACQDWPAAWSLTQQAEAAGCDSPEWSARRRGVALIAEMTDRQRRRPQVHVIEELTALAPDVTDLLILESVASEPRVSRALLIALSLKVDERAIPAYTRSLAHTHRDRARWASRALVQLGERAVPALVEAARDHHPRRRRYAIRCLGHLADPRSREVIRHALANDDDRACEQAAIALRPIARVEDIALLEQVVRERDWCTRREAVETLVALGAPGREAIAQLALTDREPTSAGWLWCHGGDQALPALLDGLNGGRQEIRAAVWQLVEGPLDDRLADQVIDCVLASDMAEEEVPLDFFVRFRHRPRAFALFNRLCNSDEPWEDHMAAQTLAGWAGLDQDRAVNLLVSMLHAHQRPDARNALVALGTRCLPVVRAARDESPDPASRQRLQTAVNDLEVCQQAETGGAITPEFLAAASRAAVPARDRAVAAFRRRDAGAVLPALASSLLHDRAPVRQAARDLLNRMGEEGQRALARARDEAAPGVAREEADRFLAKLAKKRAQLARTAS